MHLNPRQEAILQHVRSATGGSVNDLCGAFSVSAATVRRDLMRLEELGLIQRFRGGARQAGEDIAIPLPPDRKTQHLDEKRRIAAAAAALVPDGSVIILDAGTTTIEMVPYLVERRNLTIITRDLYIAMQLTAYPHIQSICIGGTIQQSSTIAGTLALRFLDQFYADQVFLGVLGISTDGGIWTANGEEALVKLESMRKGRRCVLLADSTKLGHAGGTLVANTSQVQALITDTGVAPETKEALQRSGLHITIV